MKTRILLLTLAAAAIPSSWAATRTSANYSLTTETTDAGGLRTTSAAYVHDGSLGGIVGIGTVAVPSEVAKHGYIGQLFELNSLALSATPVTVNESSTRPVHAAAVLDDTSRFPLADSSVTWSVVSGPLAGINANGLVTAAAVYQDSPATVRGIYLNATGLLGLTVLNANPDNFGLYAGDGMDDAWQVDYFGIDNPNAFPAVDYDGDGQTNAFEYVAGTNPTNAASKFLLRIDNVPGHSDQKALVFSPRFPTRTYAPVFRDVLDGGSFNPLSGTTTNDNVLERTVTDLHATNTARFYRVQITLSP